MSPRASLAVQWLRVHHQCRGHGFDPWSRKIPTCPEATWSLAATATEPGRSRARAPREALGPQQRAAPARCHCGGASHGNEDPAQLKISNK